MKNLNMKKKIIAAFGAVIVCFIIALVFTILGMRNTASKYTTFYSMRYESTMRARNIRINLQSATKNMLLAMVEPSDAQTEAYLNETTEELSVIESELEWFDTEFDGDKTQIDSFKTILSQLNGVEQEIMELTRQNTEATDKQKNCQ